MIAEGVVPAGEPLFGDVASAVGMIALVDVPALLKPSVFVAVTRKVYGVPLLRPVMSQVSGPETHEQICPPGTAVTV